MLSDITFVLKHCHGLDFMVYEIKVPKTNNLIWTEYILKLFRKPDTKGDLNDIQEPLLLA